MSLPSGTRLGPYEIVAPIGAGGMGEVFRAKDPRLGRDVAVKVLPSSLSADADRLRRFEQEARAAGILNHPNITAVYDVGQHDGAPYVVQELLEGETLRAALSGKLPQRKAIDYALQIAHGLTEAHEKGIVHRDLKPENLFVTKDGRLKILDFGLAKLTEPGGGLGAATNLPTASAGTEPGVVLGTLGYMSPEQVKGKPADARSDIFSFGAILYEMLSGRRAFHGDSAAETMSAILREEPPDLSATNQNVSPGLERIVRHCLEKSPEQRFRSAHDVAFALEALSGTSGASGAAALPNVRSRRRWPLFAAAAVAMGALGLLVGRETARRGSARPGGSPASFQQLTAWAGHKNTPALSPDGQTFTYTRFTEAGAEDVWSQRVGGQVATNLTKDCAEDDNFGVFSPDGGLIVYRSGCNGGGIFVMGATGENVRRLASFGVNPDWFPDGKKVVFSTMIRWNAVEWSGGRGELWTADLASGKTEKLFGGDAVQPSVSPHGSRIAFWAIPDGSSQRDIWTIPAAGLRKGETPVPVTQDAAVDWNPVWSADGRWLYFLSDRNGTFNLWRIAIEEASGRVRGEPEPVTLPARAVMQFRLSKDGRRIIYMAREWAFHVERFALDAVRGAVAAHDEIWNGTMLLDAISVSRDGRWLASGSRGKQEDIYLMRSDGTGLRKLTDDAWGDRQPIFSPDGSTIAFVSDRGGRAELWTIGIDGSALTQLTRTSGEGPAGAVWSPDGRYIAFARGSEAQLLPMSGARAAGPLETLPSRGPGLTFVPKAWSADGRHLFGRVKRSADDPATDWADYTVASRSYEKFPVTTTARDPVVVPLSDGRRCAISIHERRGIDLYDTRSGETHPLLPASQASYIKSWAISADEKLLFINRATEQADIWLANLE